MSLSATFVIAIAAAVLAILAVSTFVLQPLGTIWLTLLYLSGVKEK
jgi:energy-converting hydrogenase Eha subunit C